MSVALKRTMRTTCDRLGIVYAERPTGWRRSRYGNSPILSLVVSAEDAQRLYADRALSASKRSAANRAARKSRADATAALADSLGVLPGSRTLAAYRCGDIDAAEAQRIGEVTRARHEDTEYDALLARGIDRETAREMIRSN